MGETAAALDPGFGDALQRLDDALAQDSPDRLRSDHARLFHGRAEARASPYGSAWLDDGALMGDSTLAVLQHYEDGGFEVGASFPDLPDHVAIELEYLCLLLGREAAATARGDTETLRGVASLRARFLAEHLGAWIAPFAAAVRAGAESAFFRELATLTERFVTAESRRAGP